VIVMRFDPRFASDLDSAISWYERIAAEIADDFRQTISRSVDSISQHPESHPILELPIRVAMLKRFPWLIVYRFESDVVVFLRFIHSSSSTLL